MYPPPAVLYAPVAVWAASGVGLAWAFRSSAPTTVLRFAAAFLALWSLLATTALAWVLTNGGWPALLEVARSPGVVLAVFGLSDLPIWIDGAIGAFAILAVAFVVNQAVGRGLLHLLDPVALSWPGELPTPATPVALYESRSPRPEAFSFTLLARTASGGLGRREVIVLSAGLTTLLTEDEKTAVIAHELGHIRDLDARYLTFLRTLARMMRWDPLFAYIAASLTRREEYEADDDAVRTTGRPLALARAIYKASVGGTGSARSLATASGLLGNGGERGHREALARIRRLVAMAESGAPPPEGPGA